MKVVTTASEGGSTGRVLLRREEDDEMHTPTRMQTTIGRHTKNIKKMIMTVPLSLAPTDSDEAVA